MIPDSQFTSTFLNLNPLAGKCTGWLFLPGMLFKETQAWWKEDTPRQSPHEGIDLRFLADRSRKLGTPPCF